jgi:hypothetical protein
VDDDVAVVLMGLDAAGNYSMDGPLANVLFVGGLRLNGTRGNRCGQRDIACAFKYAGGALIEKRAALQLPDVLKHEIGHLHGLDHSETNGRQAIDGEYLSVGANLLENRISDRRCQNMRRFRPEEWSPWFIKAGGTIETAAFACQ